MLVYNSVIHRATVYYRDWKYTSVKYCHFKSLKTSRFSLQLWLLMDRLPPVGLWAKAKARSGPNSNFWKRKVLHLKWPPHCQICCEMMRENLGKISMFTAFLQRLFALNSLEGLVNIHVWLTWRWTLSTLAHQEFFIWLVSSIYVIIIIILILQR